MKIKYSAELYNLYKQPSSVKMINTPTLEMARKYQGYAPCNKITLYQPEGSEKKEIKKDTAMASVYTKQSKISKQVKA